MANESKITRADVGVEAETEIRKLYHLNILMQQFLTRSNV